MATAENPVSVDAHGSSFGDRAVRLPPPAADQVVTVRRLVRLIRQAQAGQQG